MHETNASADSRSSRRLRAYLTATISLSRAQAVAGFVAATLSIAGSLFGYVSTTRSQSGNLVMIVRDRRTDQPVPDAIVEVLTPTDVLITTFPTLQRAGTRRSLKEGMYRVRVTNPRFAPETRVVQVIGGETSELRFQLSPRIPPPSVTAATTVPRATPDPAPTTARSGTPAKPGAARATATSSRARRSTATKRGAAMPVSARRSRATTVRPAGAQSLSAGASVDPPRGPGRGAP